MVVTVIWQGGASKLLGEDSSLLGGDWGVWVAVLEKPPTAWEGTVIAKKKIFFFHYANLRGNKKHAADKAPYG
jgi:hypothetical protein